MRWVTVRGPGRYLAVLVALLVIFTIAAPYRASGIEARPEVRYGNIVAGTDSVESGISQELFHQQTLSMTDEEAMAISFQAEPCHRPGGSVADIVTPSIAQTSQETIAATSIGVFEANYEFCPGINFGAAPVGHGQLGKPSPVTAARFFSRSLLYPEMVVQGNLLKTGSPQQINEAPISLPPPEMGTANNLVRELANEEAMRNAPGFYARSSGMPVILSSLTIDFDATPDQINQASIVERLWRNVKQASILDYAYEGDAAFPEWIAPIKNPYQLIGCGGGNNAIKASMEMTAPGTFLIPSFWSL